MTTNKGPKGVGGVGNKKSVKARTYGDHKSVCSSAGPCNNKEKETRKIKPDKHEMTKTTRQPPSPLGVVSGDRLRLGEF